MYIYRIPIQACVRVLHGGSRWWVPATAAPIQVYYLSIYYNVHPNIQLKV